MAKRERQSQPLRYIEKSEQFKKQIKKSVGISLLFVPHCACVEYTLVACTHTHTPRTRYTNAHTFHMEYMQTAYKTLILDLFRAHTANRTAMERNRVCVCSCKCNVILPSLFTLFSLFFKPKARNKPCVCVGMCSCGGATLSITLTFCTIIFHSGVLIWARSSRFGSHLLIRVICDRNRNIIRFLHVRADVVRTRSLSFWFSSILPISHLPSRLSSASHYYITSEVEIMWAFSIGPMSKWNEEYQAMCGCRWRSTLDANHCMKEVNCVWVFRLYSTMIDVHTHKFWKNKIPRASEKYSTHGIFTCILWKTPAQ